GLAAKYPRLAADRQSHHRAGLPRGLADGAIAKKQRRLFIHRLRVIAFSLALIVFLAGVFVINWRPGPDT
ncbi:hypothetical protein MMI81_004145, partial [Klebsiella pneumoniae]